MNAFELHRHKKHAIALSVILSTTLHSTNSVRAQIIPDTTLGTENSIVTPIDSQLEQIEGGAIRGANLFHSFLEFRINEGNSAYFNNPAGIANIFSRVTGSNPSYLYGTLGVLGEANLFFLNPNGIVFGPNASLDLRGSFVASTAHSLIFPDGEEFSAVNPNGVPLLTLDVPVTLSVRFESDRAGSIVNAGNLAVDAREKLSLVGGTVINTGQLVAPTGEVALLAVPGMSAVELGGRGEVLGLSEIAVSGVADAPTLSELVAGSGEDLGLTVTGEGVELEGVKIPEEGGVAIASGTLDVSGDRGGKVQMLGDRVGLIAADIDASGGGEVLVGGDYQGEGSVLNASRTFVSEDSVINADATPLSPPSFQGGSQGGEGDGGRVIIWADGTTGFYGTISAIGGSEGGDGGFVEVSGKENLAVGGNVDVSASLGLNGTVLFDPRNIRIVDRPGANDAELLDNQILFGDGGNGNFEISRTVLENITGNILLQAANDITIEDLSNDELRFSPLGGAIEFSAGGNFVMSDRDDKFIADGRHVSITGKSITTGDIETQLQTFGNSTSGGDITLIATEDIVTTNIRTDSQDVSLGGDSKFGAGGNITFIAGGNILAGIVSANTSAFSLGGDAESGAGGNITLIATGNIHTGSICSDSRATSIFGNAVARNGGEVVIQANGSIQSKTIESDSRSVVLLGSGNAISSNGGNVEVIARNDISMGGDFVRTSSFALSTNGTIVTGDGGDITARSREGRINTSGGTFDSSSVLGNGGNITFEANGNVTVAGIFNTTGRMESGDITMNSNNGAIAIKPGSIINTGSLNFPFPNTTENGGNIRLQANNNIEAERAIFNTAGNVTSGNIEFDSRNGEIDLQATVLNLGNGSSILRNRVNSLGNVRIRDLLRKIGADPSSLPVVQGSGGNVEFSALGDINLEQSFINTSGNDSGAAGRGTFNSGGAIALEESFIGNTFEQGTGQDFNFNSQSFSLNRSAISTRTIEDAEAGDININATDFVELNNGSFLGTQNRGRNPNGDVTINTKRVTVGEGSLVSTSTDGDSPGGKGGRITIDATDSIEVFGSSGGTIPSSIASVSSGEVDAGTVDITTNRLILRDGGLISTATSDRGQGGDVNINANSVLISGTSNNQLINSSITVDTSGAGNAGNLMLNANQLIVENGGIISASVFQLENNPSSGGRGGNIEINASDVVLRETSRDGQIASGLYARSFSPEPAGSITLDIAGDLRIEDGARINVNNDNKIFYIEPQVPLAKGDLGGSAVPHSRENCYTLFLNS